ncbi:hypothetical protein GCM10029964_032710 [Kibdelosporangium lantanae]
MAGSPRSGSILAPRLRFAVVVTSGGVHLRPKRCIPLFASAGRAARVAPKDDGGHTHRRTRTTGWSGQSGGMEFIRYVGKLLLAGCVALMVGALDW